ncbi:hypothetical protein FLAG1_05035 [Fusarium langsethiae]|uniref:Uncharacterized protein n=1 Tax=Fusarium langsethiae TaxID=179993 RepID=A0A0M9EXS9_FUSLA|nr:hypothetical protein FLAG1_05035 [Fusarium langsethiae]GKU03024.1 unnamed protein product [Fusarium langsethiae]GKU19096.1 unnamed protein product [Fusarium langsethiae]
MEPNEEQPEVEATDEATDEAADMPGDKPKRNRKMTFTNYNEDNILEEAYGGMSGDVSWVMEMMSTHLALAQS